MLTLDYEVRDVSSKLIQQMIIKNNLHWSDIMFRMTDGLS